MLLTKRSMITNIEHTLELPITQEEHDAYQAQRRGGKAIQDYFPQLTAEEREFIMTGITNEEWQKYIMTFDEDEDNS